MLKSSLKWASPRENLSSVVCEQQRHRLDCAYAQSDQRLCYSLIVKYHILAWYKRNFNFLASLCSWGDWFESRFVGTPEDRFSRGEAQIMFSRMNTVCMKGKICPEIKRVFTKFTTTLIVEQIQTSIEEKCWAIFLQIHRMITLNYTKSRNRVSVHVENIKKESKLDINILLEKYLDQTLCFPIN